MTDSRSGSDAWGRRTRIRLAGLALALVTALILALLGPRPAVGDAWQKLFPRDFSQSQVELVVIDGESIAAVGPWPWPRYYLARLVEEIGARGAVAIGLDQLYPERDRLSPDLFVGLYPELPAAAADEVRRLRPFDDLFAEVIGRHPVVLGRAGVSADPGTPAKGPAPVEAEFAAPLPPSVTRYRHAVANIAEIDEVAAGHGIQNGPPDGDGIVRRLPLVADVAGQPTPGFALEIARVALGEERLKPVSTGGRLRAVALGSRFIPADRDGAFRPRLGPFPPGRIHSAADVLRQGFPADAFKGKVVLVGLAAEGSQDVVATPISTETYGVTVQAEAVDAVLRGGWLSRPLWAPALEWAAGLAIAFVTLLLVPFRNRRSLLLPLAALIAVPLASIVAFRFGSLLIDPLSPLAIGGAAAAGVFAMTFAEARRERERLRASLVEEQVAAAETAGELNAAHDIQIGMLPPRPRLAALDPRLDMDALLEPAKSVGGDFYDALRLGRNVIGFAVGDVTGKGLSAALFMTVSKALARSVMLREEGDLAAAAMMLDRELSRDDNPYMGVTMLIGFIDLATGAATLCNAGHENPLLIATDGSVADLKMEGGPPFCAVDNYPYPAERIRLAPGETLVLVTDGVTEARGADDSLFGHKRAVEAIRGAASAREASERLVAAVRAFEAGGDPSDDLTVVALRYLGPDTAA